MQRFQDKTVIVTGGGGGIGGATCRRFAREGARVAVFDMNLDAAEAVAAQIRADGGQAQAQAQAFSCDITDRAAVDAAVAAAQERFGPIDVLVNNAGWDVFKPFTKTEPAQWDKLIAINLTGALHMHHAVLPGMAARKAGRIVNIASDAARVGSSGEAVYAACKGGLVAFSKTIAREHARHGITVNVVCPGPTDTALFADYKQGAGNPEKLMEAFTRSIPLGRIGQPDDLPGAILFFAQRRRGLRDRAGAQRLGRPDDERLTLGPDTRHPTPDTSRRHPWPNPNSKTSCTTCATASPGSPSTAPRR
jgi:2-hydroxycyclohexanecarboxyl-CoA dehydrogenase